MRPVVYLAGAIIFVVFILAVVASGQNASANDRTPGLVYVTVLNQSNVVLLHGEALYANTTDLQEVGLMNRSVFFCGKQGRACIGELFDFNNRVNATSGTQNPGICMWMKNTPMNLQQIWFNSTFSEVYDYQGQAESTASVCNGGLYVLETYPNVTIANARIEINPG
ncbi:MAG: DUF192 domain-containing protein [Candidatus Micrarchaeota archaeon]|nr:DUF192 domain-containing protein [Candidatus Micrarchaeota archaeon]